MKRIRNGGFEQGIMEIAEEMGLISEKDQERLDYLRSLPQDRTEGENPIEKLKRRILHKG